MRARDGLDLVRTGAVVAGASIRLAWRRARPGAIPASIDAVTPAWLTTLVEATSPGACVRDVRPVAIDAGTTTRARLAVDVTGVAYPPATLFLKLAPPDLSTAVFVDLMGLGEREVRFYRDLASRFGPLVPRVWGSAWDPATGRFALLLGDLAAEGCTLPTLATRPATLADAEAMMRTLAAVHATRWDQPPPDWIRVRGRHRRLFLERALTGIGVGRALRRRFEWMPAELCAAAPRLLAARDHLEAAWAVAPLTVIHGDAHAGNTFRRPDGGTTGLLDWQLVQQGQGMRDVTYFLCNSVPTETRRGDERALIRLYLSELGARGVSAPSFEAAWTQHRLHAVYAWIAAAFTAGMEGLQPSDVARAGLERASTAVVDLDSLGALP